MFPAPDRLSTKICGITRPDQALAIAALGADAIGLNFWPQSKRYLPLDHARPWLAQIAAQTTLVAVTVNPDDALLDALLAEPPISIIQLHGDESPAQVRTLMDRGITVIKALQVRDETSIAQIGSYPCTDILLDAYNPGLYGGAGETFPWELAVKAREAFPTKRIVLSGGLTPSNVRQAIEQTHPAAVDVASGVESTPGIKDLALVERFIHQARSAS